jgi:hypothetical protein
MKITFNTISEASDSNLVSEIVSEFESIIESEIISFQCIHNIEVVAFYLHVINLDKLPGFYKVFRRNSTKTKVYTINCGIQYSEWQKSNSEGKKKLIFDLLIFELRRFSMKTQADIDIARFMRVLNLN